ncbi:hypothetical protein E4S40_13445 [Algoriphagus kandeliae]|uniref:DNA polymerase III subunit gamma/tau n=1 Tax=Algoriphagus kandeliae TaxID=2562278 RepID=A0A4Y9QKP6_9BACT|nr:hypothetical protein [Algoriphagus kandeliae]TFV93259.1 hypothetical protein E4S40_13445 [Algoriphagus kandeliae]
MELIPTTSVQSFTQELLEKNLPEILTHFKNLGKNLELAILQQPIKVKGGDLVIEVIGSVQEEIAEKMKPDLVGLVRKLTGANSFSVHLEVKEEIQETHQKLYTDRDKMNFLIKKHPALMELAKKFELDTDF